MAICRDPNIAGGEPHIAGTTLSVYQVSALVQSDPKQKRRLIESHGLTDALIDEALGYVAANPKKQILFG